MGGVPRVVRVVGGQPPLIIHEFLEPVDPDAGEKGIGQDPGERRRGFVEKLGQTLQLDDRIIGLGRDRIMNGPGHERIDLVLVGDIDGQPGRQVG